ncbi:hypothetical protein FEE95_04415 [Maribacter algarum]|uniref:DUF3570 domain-containing protein n=1 Tax=Maribacter algarum (ex Zhang et al. 2020) TaxID=2578118 RepID=A0A5S3PUJ4_9FLAO|nr:hypothetical protein [Maribacter algarum]TMM58679.1 hypothetical protein FEE95_04415 [Maribacter algarum]
MMRVTEYAKLLFIGGFFLGCASTWSNVTAEIKRPLANSAHILKVSDSTNSKKKGKEPKRVKASPLKSLTSQNVLRLTNLRKDVSESVRREKGNSVSTNSYAINDVFEPSTLSNVVSLNIYDKRWNVHSFSGTQSSMYSLSFTSENNVNTRRDLIGFEYRFKKADSLKFGYSARARLERDNESQTYYQLGIGANLKGEKRLNRVGLEYFPVRTGPGHVLEIYRTQFTNYNTFQLTKRLKQAAAFETNYYSDEHADFIVSARTEFLLFESELFRVSPLIEAAYSLGTINRRDSYPYWMAAKRTYGGGGFALGIGSDNSPFQMLADASIFSEVGQPNFERYTGSLSYRVENFTTLNAGFEVYTIDNFYSNVIQLGMVYNFK